MDNDWKEQLENALAREEEEKRNQKALVEEQERARRVAEQRQKARADEAKLIEHYKRFKCHVCGKPSARPDTHMAALVGLGADDYSIPVGLHQCSRCKNWACEEHLYKEICRACAERISGSSQKPTKTPALSSPVGTVFTVYHLHSRRITAVAWSPKGPYIASSSEDHTVQVWEASTGRVISTLHPHTKEVSDVAWSLDGRYLASASTDDSIQVQVAPTERSLWSGLKGREPLVYWGHTSEKYHSYIQIAWSPDGTKIASTGPDSTVQVWDAATGRTLLTYRGHPEIPNTAAWSPDGARIASDNYKDSSVHVWDAATGVLILVYSGHSVGVVDLAWSPDGARIVSAGADQTVQVWDASKGQNILTYKGHSGIVGGAVWSPDGQYIASWGSKTDVRAPKESFDATVQIWNATTSEHLFTYTGHPNGVSALAWSPDGKLLATGGWDTNIHIWRAP